MKISRVLSRRRFAAFTIVAITFVFLAAVSNTFHSNAQKTDDAPEVVLSGTITGRVYQDFNSNGIYDTASGINSIDVGVAGVTVSAYDSTGAAQGSVVTGATGNYSLAATGTGPYRLEFTTLPAGYTPSARSTDSVLGGTATDSGSTVQFVNNLNTSNVNLALTRGEEYCQDNPTLVTSRYAQGASNGTYANNPVLYDFPYGAGTTYTDTTVANYDVPTTHSLTTIVSALGTVNSLAYNRSTNRLYAAAYYKRHAGFGPGFNGTLNNSDDPGAIYVINPSTSAITSTFTVPSATTNSHNTADYSTDNNDIGWNGTGKTSLGGMALADDNSRLFVMNLETRTLYALDPTTGTNLGNSANPDGLTMNTPGGTAASCATGNDRRPFAVKYYRGSVYIGVVCTAESTSNVNNLFAYVFAVNPTTLAITTTPVYSVALNYTRGFADPTWPAEWQPWKSTVQAGFAYPQPWLTDIEFDNGNLILSLRDRTGDSALDLTKRTAGDTIRACGSFGAWTTETNGRCGGTGTAPQGTGQGLGNGEFYHQDDFCLTPNGADYHDEISWGAILQLPGRQNVITTVLDAINRTISDQTFDGGIRLFNNTSGGTDRAYRLFNGSGGAPQPDFGKSNGMGDLAALCNSAPIEIGNRVWRDTNNNGVQDPGELGIAGVTTRLYKANAPVNFPSTPYADNFTAIAYNGSTGSTDWSTTPWAEISDDTVVTTGDVQVVLDGTFSNALRLNRASRGASRAVDLTCATTATLTFNYRRQTSQGATVEYSTNGTTWTNLGTYGAAADAAYLSSGSISLPVTATFVRFLNAAANGNTNYFFVDNIQISTNGNCVKTDGNGEYYFTNLLPSMTYEVRFDNPANYLSGGPLFGLVSTTVNQTSQQGDDDSSDSDAVNVTNPTGSPSTGTFPVITLTTGGAGANNHTFDVGFRLTPSAANVSLQGRTMLQAGNGIRNVRVTLTEQDGTQHYATTGSFGYFRFDDLRSGQTVIVSVAAKRYTFSQPDRVVSLQDNLTDFDFIADE